MLAETMFEFESKKTEFQEFRDQSLYQSLPFSIKEFIVQQSGLLILVDEIMKNPTQKKLHIIREVLRKKQMIHVHCPRKTNLQSHILNVINAALSSRIPSAIELKMYFSLFQRRDYDNALFNAFKNAWNTYIRYYINEKIEGNHL